MDGAKIPPVDIITSGSPCFVAGTLITTKHGDLPIEKIQVGDMVLTHTGNYRSVIGTMQRETDELMFVSVDSTKYPCPRVVATPNHPFYARECFSKNINEKKVLLYSKPTWKWAKDLSTDDLVSCVFQEENGEKFFSWLPVRTSHIQNNTTVYNLEVETDNSYCANGFVVHNCQSFSVAGKREGLCGESGLFFDAIRVVRQMRMSTGGVHCRFYILENVPGTLSSNGNMDFRTILESITECEIPMPRSGGWANAGLVRSRRCDVGWRILDAQYFRSTEGVFLLPQRRKRLWLVADFAETGRCVEKILFECESLQGDTEPSGKTRERTPSTAEKSTRTASELVHRGGTAVVKIRSGRDDGTAGKGALIGIEQSFTLGCGNDQTLFQERKPIDDLSTTGGQNATLYENHAQDYRVKEVSVAPTIGTRPTTNPPIVMENIPSFKAFDEYNFSVDSKVKTLEARDFKGGAIVFRQDAKQTMESIPSETYTIPHDERSMCCQPGMSDTLTHYVHYVAYSMGHDERSSQFEENKTDPLTASDYKQPPVVAQPMSTTGGQNAYAIGNGQTAQLKMQDMVGTLNCMHDQIAIMQKLATEDKSQEVCALTMDEDSTDKM